MGDFKDIKDEASKRLQENIQKYGILVLQTDLEKEGRNFYQPLSSNGCRFLFATTSSYQERKAGSKRSNFCDGTVVV